MKITLLIILEIITLHYAQTKHMQLEITLVFKLTSLENKPENSTQGGFSQAKKVLNCLLSMNL